LEAFLEKLQKRLHTRKQIHRELHWFYRSLWVAGGFVLLGAGLAMLVLPGPGILVVTLALGALALEFSWAEWILRRGIETGMKLRLPSARMLFLLATGAAIVAACGVALLVWVL
jgi:hypothetical protein